MWRPTIPRERRHRLTCEWRLYPLTLKRRDTPPRFPNPEETLPRGSMVLHSLEMLAVAVIEIGLWAVGILVHRATQFRSGSLSPQPPGPPGLPILGSLLSLGELPHRDLYRLAKQYGPIMLLRLGLVPTVVISSPHAAQAILKTHDMACADRPSMEAGKYMGYDTKTFSLSKYRPYCTAMKKLCTVELLSGAKVDSFKGIREQEIGLLIESLRRRTEMPDPVVDVSAMVSSLSTDLMCLMLFGKKYADDELNEKSFKAVIRESMKTAGQFHIADFIPCLGALDLQGSRHRMKRLHRELEGFLEQIVQEHMEHRDRRQHRDFIDVVLSSIGSTLGEMEIGIDNVKAVIKEMLFGGVDTAAAAMEWTFAELLRSPRVMKKLRRELDDVVGVGRMANESDLQNLEYLEMVLKESLRMHPPSPLMLPHESREDIVAEGFYIPRNSRIIVNAVAIGRDSDTWDNADDFWPERFAGTRIDVRGQDFELLPFGSGRRRCPGIQHALTWVLSAIAKLVHCFNWELPDGLSADAFDMTEEYGLTLRRATPVFAVPSSRLQC